MTTSCVDQILAYVNGSTICSQEGNGSENPSHETAVSSVARTPGKTVSGERSRDTFGLVARSVKWTIRRKRASTKGEHGDAANSARWKDLFLTQRFAHHANPITTVVYTHLSDEELYSKIDGI